LPRISSSQEAPNILLPSEQTIKARLTPKLEKGYDRQALLSQPTQGWSRKEVADWIRQKSITAKALFELSELNGHDLLALREEDLLKISGGLREC